VVQECHAGVKEPGCPRARRGGSEGHPTVPSRSRRPAA
jgi:hypothetical protein